MAEQDLKVIVKAKELALHSFLLTSNCNRYPKKYRHSLVDQIQKKSLEIYDTLLEANTINNQVKRAQRKYRKMAKLVAAGRMKPETLKTSLQAYKNHISHGNCHSLCKSIENMIHKNLEGAGEAKCQDP
jgi:hypothetical protein